MNERLIKCIGIMARKIIVEKVLMPVTEKLVLANA